MAEYVRFRWATAKVGASMALLALVAGVTDRARATTSGPPAQAAGSKFLKLGGLTKTISYDFLKLETKMIKMTQTVASLDTRLVKIDRNLTRNYYKAQSINKIFLKTADANLKYLPAGGTALDSKKLGGVAASGFYQGKGSVVSGALSSLSTNPATLLSVQGGIIAVLSTQTPGAGVTFTIHNGTGGAGVASISGQAGVAVKPNGDTQLTPIAVQSPAEIQVQIFPSAGFSNVVSILIGLTPNPSTNQPQAVAQAFTGGV
ncbi:MAG: hypothetical protein ACXVFQ_24055 [Solirubrobacteraceae bacterium]